MKKLEYKEFKEEHIKDFFNKVLNDNYRLLIINGKKWGRYFGYGWNETIVENGLKLWDYEQFESSMYYMFEENFFDKFIIDKEKKFIVIC